MKKAFIYGCIVSIFLAFSLKGQPNICQNLPAGYQKGGAFDISITNNNLTSLGNYLCLTEKADDARISVIDKSGLSNVRYMFGIDNSTNTLPSSTPLITYRDISGDNAGAFWIVQWGEDNGQKKLNCQKVQVDVSSRPQVTVSSCKDEEITLNIRTDEAITYYSIQWNDKQGNQKVDYKSGGVSLTHQYTDIPTSSIKIVAVYENASINKTCNSVEIPITPPSIFQIKTLETQDFGNQISAILNFKNPEHENLTLQYSEDKGITYKTAFTTNLGIAFVSNLPKKDVCFRLQYKQNASCNYNSEPVCSIYPKAVNNSYGQIDVSWNSIGKQTNYTVKRTGGTTLSETTDKTTYTDEKLDCNGNYNYQIIGVYQNKLATEVEVISSFVRSNANFTPMLQAKQGLVATLGSNMKPQLNILDATGSLKYYVYRSKGSNFQNFTKIAEITDSQYIDNVDASKDKYCYMIRHEDACQYVSPASQPFCTIFLEANQQDLNWNTPTEAPNYQIVYDVNRINSTDITTISNQTITNYSVTNPTTLIERYQIEANLILKINGEEYKIKSLSNVAEINFDTKIFLPQAFSPNGDGINDEYQVFGNLDKLQSFRMQIYNKWGNVVFESDDLKKGWDGQIANEKADLGIYTVRITYIDSFGNTHVKYGVVSLMR